MAGKSESFTGASSAGETEVIKLLHELLEHTRSVAAAKEQDIKDKASLHSAIDLIQQQESQFVIRVNERFMELKEQIHDSESRCAEECFPRMKTEIANAIITEFEKRKKNDSDIIEAWWKWRKGVDMVKYYVIGGSCVAAVMGSWIIALYGPYITKMMHHLYQAGALP